MWEGVCRLYANTTPFNITDLSIPAFWMQGVPEPILLWIQRDNCIQFNFEIL